MGKKSENISGKMNFFAFGAEGALPISDRRFGRERPGEHFWAAKPHKHPGRSRPNRGFRLRSFCSPVLAYSVARRAFISKSGRTRRVCFDQNTACGSVFCRAEPHGRGEGSSL